MLYLVPPVHVQCLECDIYLCFFYIFQGLFKPSFLFYAALLTHITVLEVLAYLTLYYFGTGWLPFIVSMLLYATMQVSLNHSIRIGAVMVVWLLDLLLPRQSVLVTTKAVSLNPAHG